MKLSVIIPVAAYNVKWFGMAYDSAKPFADEIIVITDKLLRPSIEVSPFKGATHILTVDSPPGPEPAINAGIAVATGTHFSFLCSDDFYLDGFAAVKAEASNNDTLAVCYGRVIFSGLLSGRWPESELLTDLEFQNCIPAAAIVRREWWWRIGGYRDVRYSDWDFWKRLKLARDETGEPPMFRFAPADFYHYRAWEGTVSARYGYRSDLGHEWGTAKSTQK